LIEKAKGLLTEKSINEILRLKGIYPQRKSAILMVLHVIYQQFSYIDREALSEAAELMELPLIDFEQAASFYTLFPNRKVGKYHIQVCRTLSCHLRGALELTQAIKEILGIDIGEVTSDGLFSLVEVECLGSCGTAPMMQINEDYYENLTRESLQNILNDLRQKARNG
jgi:NADH-quinone oxidoreductase E subunit